MEVMKKSYSRAHFATGRARKKPMDRLSQESTEALEHGMSYGKYKALQFEAAKGKPTRAQTEPLQEFYDQRLKYEITCQVCGAVVLARTNKKKYCSETCAKTAFKEMAKARKEGKRNGTNA